MRRALTLVVTLATAGCFAGLEGDQTLLPTTGELILTITPPTGLTPTVNVAGPLAFARSLTASATLHNLLPGDYTVTPAQLTLPTALVDTIYFADVGDAPQTVKAGVKTKLDVTYAVRPGTGSLWVTQLGDPRVVKAFGSATLMQGADAQPALKVAHGADLARAIAFDDLGNLWVLGDAAGASVLTSFDARSLGELSPTRAPKTLPAGRALTSFVFDRAGGVWATSAGDTISGFTAAQLAAGDVTTPAVSVRAPDGTLSGSVALTFDLGGSLWISSASQGIVTRFSGRQLAQSGYAVPPVTLSGLDHPGPLAIDSLGNLWIAAGGKILRLDALEQGASGVPSPRIHLDLGPYTVASMAFDALGDLWALRLDPALGAGALVMFTPGQLAVGGPVTPFVSAMSPDQHGVAGSIALDPPPAGLPILGSPALPK